MLHGLALEDFIVAFILARKVRILIGVHVCVPQLTQLHISCPPNRGNASSLNHFYDPLATTSYGKGLSDSAGTRFLGLPFSGINPDKRVLAGTNSFAWASISNGMGINFHGELLTVPLSPF